MLAAIPSPCAPEPAPTLPPRTCTQFLVQFAVGVSERQQAEVLAKGGARNVTTHKLSDGSVLMLAEVGVV